ncbi:EAL domain-containing protein [Pantoea sp. LS15]|uniref:EAL domain-containing protein n=1 Tax=Enterobacterales TaxID=91347 RepID=UPI000E0F228A|nr:MULTISPECIES: EAL domain-containing protein [Enterobacterales]NJQ18511.1 EAL domain-containing protein [Pantoea sp. LS15]NKF45107.1 EAL domain-containing protein [Pantoea sp. LS15]RDK16551.1 EAL domain-containing protein [Enterobacter sp. 9-2]
MKFFYDNRSCTVRVFYEPVVSTSGNLYAIELLSRIISEPGGDTIPSANFFKAANKKTVRDIFILQLRKLAENFTFLEHSGIRCSINLTFDTAEYVLANQGVQRVIDYLKPCLCFEVSEIFFKHADTVVIDNILYKLMSLCPLWLDDFGSKASNYDALGTGFFSAVKLSAETFHSLASDSEGRILLSALISYIESRGMTSIIEGIEDELLFSLFMNTRATAAQGYFWPGDYELHDLVEKYTHNN